MTGHVYCLTLSALICDKQLIAYYYLKIIYFFKIKIKTRPNSFWIIDYGIYSTDEGFFFDADPFPSKTIIFYLWHDFHWIQCRQTSWKFFGVWHPSRFHMIQKAGLTAAVKALVYPLSAAASVLMHFLPKVAKFSEGIWLLHYANLPEKSATPKPTHVGLVYH